MALYRRAYALEGTGTRAGSDSAILLYRAAIARDSSLTDAYIGLAVAYLARVTRLELAPTWRDTALALARRARAHDPARSLHVIGQAYGDRGEHAWALEALNVAAERDSTSASVAAALGSRYFQIGDAERAIYWHGRAAALDSTRFSIQLGFAYLFLNELDSAVAAFERYLARVQVLSDANLQAFGGLNLVRFVRGQFHEAVQTAESLATAHPTNAFVWALVGEARLFSGDHPSARRHFERALELSPTTIEQFTARSAALPLAYLYVAAGETARARPLIERGTAWAERRLRQGREPFGSYYAFAAIQLMQGDTSTAYHWLEAAADAGMPQARLVPLDPLFAGLRDRPRFQQFVAQLEWRLNEGRRRWHERRGR